MTWETSTSISDSVSSGTWKALTPNLSGDPRSDGKHPAMGFFTRKNHEHGGIWRVSTIYHPHSWGNSLGILFYSIYRTLRCLKSRDPAIGGAWSPIWIVYPRDGLEACGEYCIQVAQLGKNSVKAQHRRRFWWRHDFWVRSLFKKEEYGGVHRGSPSYHPFIV